MMRLILILIVVALTVVGGLAVALNHYYGWKGLVALPFILAALAWLAKVVIGSLVKKFFLGLFGMKSVVLRDAAMVIHSVRPVAKMPEPPLEMEDSEEDDDADGEPATAGSEAMPAESEEPRHYYEVDVTITPHQKSGDRVWEPTELILTSRQMKSLGEMEEDDCDIGHTQDCLIWNGNVFAVDEVGKHPGEQRLLLTMAVKPGTTRAWVHYYDVPLGELELPPWEPRG